jgi:hypothetical protein
MASGFQGGLKLKQPAGIPRHEHGIMLRVTCSACLAGRRNMLYPIMIPFNRDSRGSNYRLAFSGPTDSSL